METTYNEFDVGTQTLYAQLLTSLLADVSGGRIPAGTLVTKRVRGRAYWYAQYAEVGRQRQVYLGSESAELTRRLDELRDLWAGEREDAKSREILVSMLLAAGAQGPDNLSAKVMELLANHGVFAVGGVLVGSHAFAAYGPMLGVSWGDGWKTADIDIAQEARVQLALAERADLPAALLATRLPFREIPALDHRQPSTSFSLRGKQLQVDVLTPLVGPPVDGPIFLPKLNVAAQPLRFLDYLIEDHQPAALVGRSGILINVPTPARFALHKLIVAQERPAAFQAKATKDLSQATQLIQLLADVRPGDLVQAWRALSVRGARWIKRVDRSVDRLDAHTQALVAKVRATS